MIKEMTTAERAIIRSMRAPIEHARKDVLTELVSSEEVRSARWLRHHGKVDLIRRKRCNPRREDARRR